MKHLFNIFSIKTLSLIIALFFITFSVNAQLNYSKPNELLRGNSMSAGETIRSNNSNFHLFLYNNGDLVLVKGTITLWHSNTTKDPATKLIFKEDGNLVLVNSLDKVVWQTNSLNTESKVLKLEDDGNLVISNFAINNFQLYLTGYKTFWTLRNPKGHEFMGNFYESNNDI